MLRESKNGKAEGDPREDVFQYPKAATKHVWILRAVVTAVAWTELGLKIDDLPSSHDRNEYCSPRFDHNK